MENDKTHSIFKCRKCGNETTGDFIITPQFDTDEDVPNVEISCIKCGHGLLIYFDDGGVVRITKKTFYTEQTENA